MNRRGELTTQQIVILIVLLISFAVILFFLLRLNFGESSEKEICHNSVIMKGNTPLGSEVSLNCQRTYVCLTKDGTCETMTNPNIEKVESIEEIYSVLANELADCWWMFGEGKIDYIGNKATEKNYCSICSQIAFDDSITEIEEFSTGEINKDEFYDYLSKTEIFEGSETYAQYFFGTNDIASLVSEISGNVNNSEKINTFGTIYLDEQYFVIMGITSQIGGTYKWIGRIIEGVGVVTLFIPGINVVSSAIIISAGIGAVGFGADLAEKLYSPKIVSIIVKGDGIDNEFMVPTIIEASSEAFELLNCKDIVTLS